MNKMTVVYQHIRKSDNIVFYIGIGNKVRPYVKSTRSIFWKNEVNKHDYIIEILSDNLSLENAEEAEVQLIKLYGRRDLGLGSLVNLTDGGDGAIGCKPSTETKNKISKSLQGKNKGSKNGMFGKNGYCNKTHYRARKIINTETLIIYETIRDVLNIIEVPKTTFLRWLKYPEKNKTLFKYFE